MEKRAQWWAVDAKHWKRGEAAWSGGLGVAHTALPYEISVIALRLLSRPGFIPSQPQSAEMALREASLSELLWGPRWHPTLAQASPMTFFLAPKESFPGRSVCDLGKLRSVRWGSGDLRGLPELTHLCWPESNSFLMPFLLPPLIQSVAMSCPFHPFHAPQPAGIR